MRSVSLLCWEVQSLACHGAGAPGRKAATCSCPRSLQGEWVLCGSPRVCSFVSHLWASSPDVGLVPGFAQVGGIFRSQGNKAHSQSPLFLTCRGVAAVSPAKYVSCAFRFQAFKLETPKDDHSRWPCRPCASVSQKAAPEPERRACAHACVQVCVCMCTCVCAFVFPGVALTWVPPP